MTILDQLLEKKDLTIYLDLREAELKEEVKRVVASAPLKKRETAKERVKGRIMEVNRLKKLVNEGWLKTECKRIWRKTQK